MSRGGGDGRDSRIVRDKGLGGPGGGECQLTVACGQCGAHHPGRNGRIAEQQPSVRSQIGKNPADVGDRGDRAVAGLADLGFGRGVLDARVEAGEVRHLGGAAGDVACRGRDVAAAQRDHGQNGVRG